MADSPDDIQAWPATAQALTDTHLCPGCFTTISLPVCPVCGFVLTDPRALEVLALGRGIFSYEVQRQRLIDDVRREHRTAPAPVSVPAPAPAPDPVPVSLAQTEMTSPEPAPFTTVAEPVEVAVAAVGVAGAVRAPAEPVAPPIRRPRPVAAASPADTAPPRRRLTVPVLLLVVGVSLVGVAAIFFLLLAWFTANIAVRALIIGAITVATIATASLLRRRSLTATAEGIAVLGVLLLALDAWAVRANDLFGTGSTDAALYAGVGILAVGVFCRVWARLSALRSPDLAAALALPVGLGLLFAGLLPLPNGQAIVIGLLGAAAGGLGHALPAPWSAARTDAVLERAVLASIGVLALAMAAFAAAIASPGDLVVPLWSGAAIVVLGTAHAFALRPREEGEPVPASRSISAVALSVAVAVAALTGWQLALRENLPLYTLLVGPVVALLVAVVVDRAQTGAVGRALIQPGAATAAQVTGVIIGGTSLLVTIAMWLLRAQQSISAGWITWRTDAFASPAPSGSAFAVIAGILIAAALFAAPSLGAPVIRDLRVIAAAGLVMSGVAVTAIPAAIVAAAAVVATGALLIMRERMLRPGALVAAGLAALVAFTAGTASPWLWAGGMLVALAVPILAQMIVRPSGVTAAWFTLAPVVVATVSTALAPAALGAATDTAAQPGVTPVLLQWVALIALAVAVASRLPRASRTTLAVSAYAVIFLSFLAEASVIGIAGLVGTTADPPAAVLGDPALAVVRSLALLAVLAVVSAGRTRIAPAPALAAAALVAPLAAIATLAVLRSLGLGNHGATALAAIGASAAVALAAAVSSTLQRATAGALRTRWVIDLGALATTLVAVWGVSENLRWIMWAIIGIGVAATSISRGWAAPVTATIPGVASTRAAGTHTAEAPRRLLAWPAFGFAVTALWTALWSIARVDELSLEAWTIAPAVGLAGFGMLLVWLRRHGEAAVAVTAAIGLGLIVPALWSWFDTPVRGTIVAIVAAAVCLALSCTVLRRARLAAASGAVAALLALAAVVAHRALTGEAPDTLWLVLLVGVAYASGLGAASARSTHGRSWYAAVVPPLVLGVAVLAALPSAHEPTVLTGVLVALAALHTGAALVRRAPFAAATRWTSLTAMIVYASAAYAIGAVQINGIAVVELVSVPIALTALAASVLAQWRLHGEVTDPSVVAIERGVWLVGVLIAVLPSVIAPIDPLRAWWVISLTLVSAAAAILLPIAAVVALRVSTAALLTAGALLMALRMVIARSEPFAEPAALVAGAGAVVIAVLLVLVGAAASTRLSVWTSAAGVLLMLSAMVIFDDGELVRSTVTTIGAGVLGVAGAALLGAARWRGLGAVLAIGGFAGALIGAGARFLALAGTAAWSVEADLWAAIALASTAAIGTMALRSTTVSPLSRVVGAVTGSAVAIAVALFAAAEWVLINGATAAATTDAARTVLTMSTLSAAGVGGVLARARLGLTLPVVAGASAALFGLAALISAGVTPVELVTVPPAVGLLALGARALQQRSAMRSWPALGPGLALLTVPSLLHDFGHTALWRTVALGVVAVALVVIGAVRRLQAPLVLGSAVLLVHAVAQLWPWISAAYVFVPWWLWLGIGGALLIYLAARYERRMRALRTAFTTVAGLR